MKQLLKIDATFKNRYFVLRHGRSLANVEGIIISNEPDGIEGWGLAPGSASDIKASFDGQDLPSDTVIFSSPFKRARETALVAAETLKCAPPQTAPSLRERFFGSLDKSSHSHYPTVWTDDALDAENNRLGVESPAEVLQRLSEFILETDSAYSGRTILLVSHGDPLNILLSSSGGSPLTSHMNNDSMKTAELRYLFG